MTTNGISRLIAVTQITNNNANDRTPAYAENMQTLVNSDLVTQRLNALEELRAALINLRQTLSPAAAALLNEWLELAENAIKSA